MKGIINILKPPGMTSFDVIFSCRKLFGIKKIGHAGTLDPGAAGVLTICIGRATKVVPFLTETRKVYRAEMEFGTETTTLDAFGEVTNQVEDFMLNEEEIRKVLDEFKGEIEQVPPMYSAIRHKGKRLYELARQGKKVERKPRKITIYDLKLIDFDGQKLIIDVECSKGTYIRTLCADIGKRLEIGAYMSFLVRTKVGEFSLDKAITLEELEFLVAKDRIEEVLEPLDKALEHLKAIKVKSEFDEPISNGVSIEWDNLATKLNDEVEVGEKFRVYNSAGDFIGVYTYHNKDIFKPERIFV
ncbi:tRNA pseudouridine(55) synthase TruB [Orenia metallireducens]|uniref:tRNA pseudouridine synthase B n=1 Tax=Orenia metallireducens TaxID=1413210 RepID=A0A1C0AA09_9FIRM|nr:tRNA pseudouridine(55) synthase TruB [Orenia metallireducens]OCL27137.1 tRNA pseudouridine(55) synthase TruB [Orenia metallireducens]